MPGGSGAGPAGPGTLRRCPGSQRTQRGRPAGRWGLRPAPPALPGDTGVLLALGSAVPGPFGMRCPRGWGEAAAGAPAGLRCPGRGESRRWGFHLRLGGAGTWSRAAGGAPGDAQGWQCRLGALLPLLAVAGARPACPSRCDPGPRAGWSPAHQGHLPQPRQSPGQLVSWRPLAEE